MRLENRIALITGAGRGIGRAIAEAYGREGAKVAVADLTLEGAQAAVDAIEKAGGTAMALEMDVTNEQAVDDGVAAIVEKWGRPGYRPGQCRHSAHRAGAQTGVLRLEQSHECVHWTALSSWRAALPDV